MLVLLICNPVLDIVLEYILTLRAPNGHGGNKVLVVYILNMHERHTAAPLRSITRQPLSPHCWRDRTSRFVLQFYILNSR